MQNKLVLQSFSSAQDLKHAVISLSLALDSQAIKPFGEPTAGPMEVGGIKGSPKGRGKGKGKGKGKKGQWQSEESTDAAQQTPYNVCTWCEGVGHWRRECKARKAYNEQCGIVEGDRQKQVVTVAGIEEDAYDGMVCGIMFAETDG